MSVRRRGRLLLVLHADEPRRARVPAVTISLVILCLAVFILVAAVTMWRGPELPVRWFAALGLAPGALRWHTLITYWMLHEHLWHLSLNMLLLLLFGSAVEEGIGSLRFAVLFVSAAALTGLVEGAAAAYGPEPADGAMVIGASGAVAAILGVFASRYHASTVHLGGTRLRFRVLPMVVVLALGEIAAVGYRAARLRDMLEPPPANWAHMAGFLYGILSDQTARLWRAWQRRSGSIPAASPPDALDHYEDILAENPHDEEALVRLPILLLEEGEDEEARRRASDALREALDRERPEEAAARFAALRPLSPHTLLSAAEALALAAALGGLGHYEDAVTVCRDVAVRSEDDDTRGRAAVRAAVYLLRQLQRPEEAVILLETALEGAGDAEWTVYGRRLLKEASRLLSTD